MVSILIIVRLPARTIPPVTIVETGALMVTNGMGTLQPDRAPTMECSHII